MYAVFATVKQRMRSVTNIQKITKAMKMVAASKMRVAQVSTEKARGLIVPLIKSLGDLPGKSLNTFLRLVCAPGRLVHHLTAMAASQVPMHKCGYV